MALSEEYWKDTAAVLRQALHLERVEHQRLREEIEYIKNNSEGVVGWHKNGDIASWEEVGL